MTAPALGRCTACNGQVITSAATCVHCGARFKPSTASGVLALAGSVASLALWGVLALFALGVLLVVVTNL